MITVLDDDSSLNLAYVIYHCVSLCKKKTFKYVDVSTAILNEMKFVDFLYVVNETVVINTTECNLTDTDKKHSIVSFGMNDDCNVC